MTASLDVTTSEPLSTRRQLELMRDLQRLANERASEEVRIHQALAEGLQDAEAARDKAAAEIERDFTSRRASLTAEYERVTGEARSRYEAARDAAQKQYKGLRHGVESEHSRVLEEVRSERQQASWEALTVFDALKGRPRERYLETVKQLERANQEIAVLEHDAKTIMEMRRQWREFPPLLPSGDGELGAASQKAHRVRFGAGAKDGNGLPPRDTAADEAVNDTIGRVSRLAGQLREAATALHEQKVPRLFEGGNPFGVFFMIWVVLAVPSVLVLGWAGWQWVVASFGAAVVSTAAILVWTWPIARR